MKAIVASQPGGPEVMRLTDVPEPPCPADAVRVRVEAVGVNFVDTYERSGVYSVDFPMIPGREGAGIVVDTGPDVTWARPGDRVAWTASPGSYAEQVIVRESDCYHVPSAVELDVAAAALLQGLTAHMLSASVFPLGPDHTALVHAGAGGVGLLLTQMAAARGARVITTASTEEKAALSVQAGASEVIRYDRFLDLTSELPAAVRRLTGGRGVDVVYDGVGSSTFDASLASVATRGLLVLFGGASGQVPPFDLQRLARAGSIMVTRPSMAHFLLTPQERSWRSGEVFDAIVTGALDVRIGARFALSDAAEAHRALEGRKTTGKVLLAP